MLDPITTCNWLILLEDYMGIGHFRGLQESHRDKFDKKWPSRVKASAHIAMGREDEVLPQSSVIVEVVDILLNGLDIQSRQFFIRTHPKDYTSPCFTLSIWKS